MRKGWAAAWGFAGLSVVLSACASYLAQQNSLPHAYLEQAKAAAQAQDAPTTLSALSQAANASVLTPAGRPSVTSNAQTLRWIGEARQSVEARRWNDALYYINTALSDPSTILPR